MSNPCSQTLLAGFSSYTGKLSVWNGLTKHHKTTPRSSSKYCILQSRLPAFDGEIQFLDSFVNLVISATSCNPGRCFDWVVDSL